MGCVAVTVPEVAVTFKLYVPFPVPNGCCGTLPHPLIVITAISAMHASRIGLRLRSGSINAQTASVTSDRISHEPPAPAPIFAVEGGIVEVETVTVTGIWVVPFSVAGLGETVQAIAAPVHVKLTDPVAPDHPLTTRL
jgi:hypothetical protein